MSEKKTVLSRRNFLVAVGAGGAATAAALVVKKGDSAPAAMDATDKRATRGYQVTEHTSNYYRTTKV